MTSAAEHRSRKSGARKRLANGQQREKETKNERQARSHTGRIRYERQCPLPKPVRPDCLVPLHGGAGLTQQAFCPCEVLDRPGTNIDSLSHWSFRIAL